MPEKPEAHISLRGRKVAASRHRRHSPSLHCGPSLDLGKHLGAKVDMFHDFASILVSTPWAHSIGQISRPLTGNRFRQQVAMIESSASPMAPQSIAKSNLSIERRTLSCNTALSKIERAGIQSGTTNRLESRNRS